MGACDRKGCDQVMCQTYIESFGYICKECKEEFKRFLIHKNIDTDNMIKKDIIRQLTEFNSIEKDYNDTMTLDEFFEKN